MKKIALLLSAVLLIAGFSTFCGKSSDTAKGKDSPHQQGMKKDGEKGKQGKSGKKDDEIDVSKLPERMQQAIKSGRIPMSRVKEMLARRQGMGDAPTVEVQPVKRQRINAFLILNGTVEPERKVEVYSRLSAYVKQITREEGARVQKNDTLALLDDTEIRITHRQAQLALQQAEFTLKEEETKFTRSKKLKETDMISEQEYQTAEAGYNKARLDHQNKEESFKDLELQLSYTKIKAPVSGYVTERMIEVGTRVNSNQQVYTVEDFSPLLVKVYVPTTDVVNLALDMDAEATTDVLKGMIFKGKIKLINPRIDVQSGTVKVTVEVFDKTMRLKPGMFVETKILISNNPNALVIPKKSVQYKDNNAYVFAFQRGQVSKKIIKVGITEGDNIEVLDGLDEGQPIVTVGVEGLKDEMKVNAQGMRGMRGIGGTHGMRGMGRPGEGGKRPSGMPGQKPGEQKEQKDRKQRKDKSKPEQN